jgi:cobaltochelatase CobN
VSRYEAWFATLPAGAGAGAGVGPAPGTARHDGHLVFNGVDLAVLVAIRPPRGCGDDRWPSTTPTLPPAYYLAFTGGSEVWGADAIVHLDSTAPSVAAGQDAGAVRRVLARRRLGDVPFFYPFVVNDPGGAQAKRRAHAVVIDHLLPPMTRADSYDETAKLEQLFDEYSQIQSLDPTKLPALRNRSWETLTEAAIDRDLGLAAAPGDDEFDSVIMEVDGYLCSLKDAQIRGGLHPG